MKTEVFEIQVAEYNNNYRRRQSTIVVTEQIDSGDEDDFDNQKYIDKAFNTET